MLTMRNCKIHLVLPFLDNSKVTLINSDFWEVLTITIVKLLLIYVSQIFFKEFSWHSLLERRLQLNDLVCSVSLVKFGTGRKLMPFWLYIQGCKNKAISYEIIRANSGTYFMVDMYTCTVHVCHWLTSKCSRMYGGFVIPILIIAPSGITSTSCHSNSGNVTPISLPYAPVSSLVSHSSTTPSEIRKTRIQLGEQ